MKVLVVGSGPQALFILRLYNKITENIELLFLDKKVAAYSNIPNSITQVSTRSELVSVILEKLKTKDIICFTSGFEIQMVLEIYPEIFNEDNVQPKNLVALKIFSCKDSTYQEGNKLKISILPGIRLTKFLVDGADFNGPYFLKWNEENTDRKYSDFKTKIFSNADELIEYVQIFDGEARHKLIVQKYVSLSNGCNVSYLGYYKNGKHSFGMLGQQLLQYPVGITAHLVEYNKSCSHRLIGSAISLVESVSLEGFCEVEFIVDPLSRKFYLLEVNPRPCGWSSALFGKFSNLSNMVADEQKDHVIKSEKVEWVNILRYLNASLKNGFFDFIRSLCRVVFIKCYDVFSFSDIKPFLSQFRSKK